MTHGTDLARKAVTENLNRFIDRDKNPVEFNNQVAINGLAQAIDDLDEKLTKILRLLRS